MPAVSEKQEKLMQAAAHNPGGFGGVPQEVGKEFIKSDSSPVDEHQNETDIAKRIALGELSSPQKFANIWLFDLRITGTGVSYRAADDEFCFRDPKNYLTDEFVERCNGLPVIVTHPIGKSLNTETFRKQVIGAISYPYIKGEEVWGVARIYDADAAAMMASEKLSTSPMVVCRSVMADVDGKALAIEGKPLVLDHVAIVWLGVWDKGGAPTGVKSDLIDIETTMEKVMTEEEIAAKAKADAAAENEPKLSEIMSALTGIVGKVDALWGAKAKADEAAEAKAKADSDAEKEEKEKADNAIPSKEIADMAARVDALEETAKKADATDTEEKEKADAQARADAIYQLYNDSAPRPMLGEDLLAYRRRLATKYKSHSKAYAPVDLSVIADNALMGIAESQIYADAQAAANGPGVIAPGTLIERKFKNSTGHDVSEFHGAPDAWTSEFKPAGKMKLIGMRT